VIAVSLLAAGLVLGGPLFSLGLGFGLLVWRYRGRKPVAGPIRPVLLMLLVELRSGYSVLAALQSVATRFPHHRELRAVATMATVAGLDRAVDVSNGEVRVLMAHLTRASARGASAADAVRRMLDSDVAREKAQRLNRARALPVRLMVPLALLVLPGVVLLAYGPILVSLIQDLAIPF
jgi:pilus assembly protein TadC